MREVLKHWLQAGVWGKDVCGALTSSLKSIPGICGQAQVGVDLMQHPGVELVQVSPYPCHGRGGGGCWAGGACVNGELALL